MYGVPSRSVPVGYRAGTGPGNRNRPYAASANCTAVGGGAAAVGGWLPGAQPRAGRKRVHVAAGMPPWVNWLQNRACDFELA